MYGTVHLPTFANRNPPNVGKYDSVMDPVCSHGAFCRRCFRKMSSLNETCFAITGRYFGIKHGQIIKDFHEETDG